MYFVSLHVRRAEHFLISDRGSSLCTYLKPRQIPSGIKEAISLRDTARPLLFPGTFNEPVKDRDKNSMSLTAKFKADVRLQLLFN